MIKLRPKPDFRGGGEMMVEILNDKNELVGAIHPQPRGVKIISRHIENRPDLVAVDPAEPPAVIVNLISSGK